MWIGMRGKAWYKSRKRSIVDDVNLTRIVNSGYNVVDANEYVKTMSPLHTDYDSIPEAPPRFPVPPKNDSTHPDWHDEICKVFDESVFPIEGVKQALAFTKGVQVSQGLPSKILERANKISFTKEKDDMARRIVQQAILWGAHLEKLPKLKNLELPSLVPRREFGIPWKRSNEILLNNFFRLIESKIPTDQALSKMLSPQEEFRVNLRRHGTRVQFKLNTIIAQVVSTSLIKPMISQKEVEATQHLPLSDIYPFLSTANMEEANVYKESDHFAIPAGSKFLYIHTSVFSHHIPGSFTHIHPRWNNDRFTGTTILYNFATCLQMAKRKFRENVKSTLPEPITTQVIHLTGKEFQFSVLQLNTLDLEDATPTSIKNNVWVSDKMDLFSNLKNDLGREIFVGYNPEILKIVAAMYLS